jgi:UDP-glucose 4-epimerase
MNNKIKLLITGGNGNIAKIIKNSLSSSGFYIINPSREELNILYLSNIKTFLINNQFDILIHTAITGGRRLKEDSSEDSYKNIIMFENLLTFSEKFKMIINLDSGAIYDRATDILNRDEDELYTVPKDYYGFSKYVIYKRTLNYSHIYNFRIFNIFHANEEINRFIKSCFISKYNNTIINISEDKYFDFVYKDDFIKIMNYYINNLNTQDKLEKTINICYKEKYKLSDIAKMICKVDNINILNDNSNNNYCGNNTKINNLSIKLDGIEKSLILYENELHWLN